MSAIIRPARPFTRAQKRRLEEWLRRSDREFAEDRWRVRYHQGVLVAEAPADCGMSDYLLGQIIADAAGAGIGRPFAYAVDRYRPLPPTRVRRRETP